MNIIPRCKYCGKEMMEFDLRTLFDAKIFMYLNHGYRIIEYFEQNGD